MEVGDSVKVIRFGLRLSGRIGVVSDQHEDGTLVVSFPDGDTASFEPGDLILISSGN